ncbi:hypothetical protein [Streptomyces sp. NBC_00091]|uniref:hypothetical protein n=1 Tax=Streptomyces sp. NBC_00091 TaxID=2975648 RepID=UPI00225130EE|nr:hypothetical protein [Streptomyces sp. NBC_00091]MCX5378872.1 hypothetical protein [Streptomyces sp. NBC_00091]
MAKNKNQKQPAKQQPRASAQERSSTEASPEERTSQSPSPLDMAHKSKQKKFGHN